MGQQATRRKGDYTTEGHFRKAGTERPAKRKNERQEHRGRCARFTFNEAQAFFDGKDLELPTGAEVNPADILKKLINSFVPVLGD